MDITQIQQDLLTLIEFDQISMAVEFVSSPNSHFEAEFFSTVALECASCPRRVIDAALHGFVKTHQDKNHDLWVHSLFHLSPHLWKLGYKDWIKRLNEIAFSYDNRLGPSKYSTKLLECFLDHAPWDALASEYGFTSVNLLWADTSNPRISLFVERIRVSSDTTKNELLKYKNEEKGN